MRVSAVASVTEALLVAVFIQCVESVQHAVYVRASSAAVTTRRALLCRSSRQRCCHPALSTLVGLACHLHSGPTFCKKQGTSVRKLLPDYFIRIYLSALIFSRRRSLRTNICMVWHHRT